MTRLLYKGQDTGRKVDHHSVSGVCFTQLISITCYRIHLYLIFFLQARLSELDAKRIANKVVMNAMKSGVRRTVRSALEADAANSEVAASKDRRDSLKMRFSEWLQCVNMCESVCSEVPRNDIILADSWSSACVVNYCIDYTGELLFKKIINGSIIVVGLQPHANIKKWMCLEAHF